MKIEGNNRSVPITSFQAMSAQNKAGKKKSADPTQESAAGNKTTKKTSESDSAAKSRGPSKNNTYSPRSITLSKVISRSQAADNSAPIRADKVADARYRMEHGEYDSPEVLKTIIDKLLGELGR